MSKVTRAEFIETKDPRWIEMLADVRHDFYHLPEYLEFAAKHEGGIPTAFYAEDGDDRFLAPLLLRKIPAYLDAPRDWCDAATPYGYPAPIVSSTCGKIGFERFLASLKQQGLERGIISAFFRLHPLLVLPPGALTRHGQVINHGKTVYLDLSLSTEEIWSQVRQNHKRGIKKLVQSGFQVRMDEGRHFHEFSAIYAMTMERLSASEFYCFDKDYFDDLRSALGERMKLCVVFSPTGEVASAGLFVVADGIMQYHLGATSNSYLGQAPSKLFYDFAWRWAKEHGCRFVFLGGGPGGEDGSLMHFKTGFSQLQAEFFTYRMILDESKYAMLMQNWNRLYDNRIATNPGFFPAYRKPIL